MFIILNWWNVDGSDINVLLGEDLGKPKMFSTREEAEEFCNTELNGFYKVIDMEG